MGARGRAAGPRAVPPLPALVLLLLLAVQTAPAIAQDNAGLPSSASPADFADRQRRAKEDEEGERERETDDDDDDSQCGGALWELARRMPDLQTLSTVQQLTTLNFFKPFGGRSRRRRFTLFAPTDAAFFQAFNGTSAPEQQTLMDRFPALLLYHQYLLQGVTAAELAERYSIVPALGALLNDPQLTLDIGLYQGQYVVSGRAPNSFANVVREVEACGSHLLVLDAMLRPMAELSQLPKLQSAEPISPGQWRRILTAMRRGAAAAAPNRAGPLPAPELTDGMPAPAPSDIPDSSSQAAAPGVPGPPDDGVLFVAGGPAAAPLPAAAPPTPAPPLPPGNPPDCAGLAASGRLINETDGSLVAGCGGAVDGGVMSSGSTQTAVSDAGQADPAGWPPPPVSHAACALSSGAVVALLPVLVLALVLAA